MAKKFTFKDIEYDLVTPDDLETDEGVEIERATGITLMEGQMSFYGLVWISIRRKYPTTTWEDIKREKFFQEFRWVDDEEEEAPVPPTSNGDAGSSTVDAQTESPLPIDSGFPG